MKFQALALFLPHPLRLLHLRLLVQLLTLLHPQLLLPLHPQLLFLLHPQPLLLLHRQLRLQAHLLYHHRCALRAGNKKLAILSTWGRYEHLALSQ